MNRIILNEFLSAGKIVRSILFCRSFTRRKKRRCGMYFNLFLIKKKVAVLDFVLATNIQIFRRRMETVHTGGSKAGWQLNSAGTC